MLLPRFAPGQPIPIVLIPGLSEEIHGVWSLRRIAISTTERNRRRILPLFLADNGMVYMQTARHVWDQLLAADIRNYLVKSCPDSPTAPYDPRPAHPHRLRRKPSHSSLPADATAVNHALARMGTIERLGHMKNLMGKSHG
jgi:hypothetical protein